jgi:hypothetical protein
MGGNDVIGHVKSCPRTFRRGRSAFIAAAQRRHDMLAASTTTGNRQPQGKESKFSDLGDLFSPSVAYSNRIAQSRSRPPEWQHRLREEVEATDGLYRIRL